MSDKPLKESDFDIALKVYRRTMHRHVEDALSDKVREGRVLTQIVPDGDNYRAILERDPFYEMDEQPAKPLKPLLGRLRYCYWGLRSIADTGPAYDDEEADDMEALAMQLKVIADEIIAACADLGS